MLLVLSLLALATSSYSSLKWTTTSPQITNLPFKSASTDGKGTIVAAGVTDGCRALFIVSHDDGKTWDTHSKSGGGRCSLPVNTVWTPEKGFAILMTGEPVLGTPAYIFTSKDGINWKESGKESDGLYPQVTYFKGKYYCPILSAYSREPHQYYGVSSNGLDWTVKPIEELSREVDNPGLSMWGTKDTLYLASFDQLAYTNDGTNWKTKNLSKLFPPGDYPNGEIVHGAISSTGVTVLIGTTRVKGVPEVYVYTSKDLDNWKKVVTWKAASSWSQLDYTAQVACLETKPICVATPRPYEYGLTGIEQPFISVDGGNTWNRASPDIGSAFAWSQSGDFLFQLDPNGNFNWTTDFKTFNKFDEGIQEWIHYMEPYKTGIVAIDTHRLYFGDSSAKHWPQMQQFEHQVATATYHNNHYIAAQVTQSHCIIQLVEAGTWKISETVMCPKELTAPADLMVTSSGQWVVKDVHRVTSYSPTLITDAVWVYNPTTKKWTKGAILDDSGWTGPWITSVGAADTFQTIACKRKDNQPYPDWTPCYLLQGTVNSTGGLSVKTLRDVYNPSKAGGGNLPDCAVRSANAGKMLYNTCAAEASRIPLQYSVDHGKTWMNCKGNTTILKASWGTIYHLPEGMPCDNGGSCKYIGANGYGFVGSVDGITWGDQPVSGSLKYSAGLFETAISYVAWQTGYPVVQAAPKPTQN